MFEYPETYDFDIKVGLCLQHDPIQRKLSSMDGLFYDDLSFKAVQDDPVVYAFYDLNIPKNAVDLSFGTSICYPGKIGNEYYMTKGHYHEIVDAAEVYYCLQGKGILLMETKEGEWSAKELVPGRVVYIPGGWAHRSINIGLEPFITYFVFRADAGHDYATIEQNSFRKCVIEQDGRHEIIDNPKWTS